MIINIINNDENDSCKVNRRESERGAIYNDRIRIKTLHLLVADFFWSFTWGYICLQDIPNI